MYTFEDMDTRINEARKLDRERGERARGFEREMHGTFQQNTDLKRQLEGTWPDRAAQEERMRGTWDQNRLEDRAMRGTWRQNAGLQRQLQGTFGQRSAAEMDRARLGDATTRRGQDFQREISGWSYPTVKQYDEMGQVTGEAVIPYKFGQRMDLAAGQNAAAGGSEFDFLKKDVKPDKFFFEWYHTQPTEVQRQMNEAMVKHGRTDLLKGLVGYRDSMVGRGRAFPMDNGFIETADTRRMSYPESFMRQNRPLQSPVQSNIVRQPIPKPGGDITPTWSSIRERISLGGVGSGAGQPFLRKKIPF